MASASKFPEVESGGSLLLAWQVRGKRVLVVGGGEVAAGRILALLSADALITLICPTTGLSPQTTHYLTTHPTSITHHARPFHPSDLTAVPPPHLVLTALDSPQVSSQIYKQCQEARIPVNVADVPPECDFYFGSTIRRGPLQVLVSTNGKGPRVARLVRERIEEGLPGNVGGAVEKVGRLREMLRVREPGVGGEGGRRRMGWMIKVSDAYSLEDLCEMDEQDMKTLLRFYATDEVPRLECLKAMEGDYDPFDGSFGFCVGCG